MKNHRRSPRALVAATLTSLLVLGGCSTALPADETVDTTLTETTLMLNWVPNAHHAGIFAAEAAGFYEDVGIDLTIIEPSADLGSSVAVAQRRADFGISVAESILPARAGGMPLTALASLVPRNDSVFMGLSASGLTEDPTSLEGLTYGGFGGALETQIISELVKCRGGDPSKVEFIDIGDVDYLAGLEQQRFDVTWVFGGWDALRAHMHNDDIVEIRFDDHEDCIPDWYTPVLIANDAFIEEQPELVEAFLAATVAGYERVIEQPSLGSDALIAAAPELDPELMRAAVEYYQSRYALEGQPFGVMDEEVWHRFTAFLVKADMLGDASPLEGAWTNDFLPHE